MFFLSLEEEEHRATSHPKQTCSSNDVVPKSPIRTFWFIVKHLTDSSWMTCTTLSMDVSLNKEYFSWVISSLQFTVFIDHSLSFPTLTTLYFRFKIIKNISRSYLCCPSAAGAARPMSGCELVGSSCSRVCRLPIFQMTTVLSANQIKFRKIS